MGIMSSHQVQFWFLNDAIVQYHLNHDVQWPSVLEPWQVLLERYVGLFQIRSPEHGWNLRNESNHHEAEILLVQMALKAAQEPFDSTNLKTMAHGLDGLKADLVRATLLQALTHAHPFHEGTWQALMDMYAEEWRLEAMQRIFPKLVSWGVQHTPNAFFQQFLGIMQHRQRHYHDVRIPVNEFHVMLSCTVDHPGFEAYLMLFLSHPEWRIRELTAQKLLALGWQPRTRRQQAQVAVALRNEKAIQHLENKMVQALKVIRWPQRYSMYGTQDLDRLNDPDIGFFVSAMAKMSHKDWNRIELVAHYSTQHAAAALQLLQQRSSGETMLPEV